MSIDFKLPELGENVASGDVVNVLVHEGDTLSANDGVLELETEKAVVELPCPYPGKVAKIHVRKGETVKVGQLLLTLEAESPADAPAASQSPPPGTAAAPAAAASPPPPPTAAEVPAGPASRRIARELGVDLQTVHGSGPRGRITPEDVQAAAAPSSPVPLSPAPLSPALSDAWGPIRREKMPRIRRTIAEQMVRSATTIPHVTNFDDADVTELESLRHGAAAGNRDDKGVRLTLMPFVLKAVALALRAHPTLNASLDGEEVVYKDYVSVGVAVDTPRGLVVPVVRNTDRLRIAQLAEALAALAQRTGRPSSDWKNSAAARSRSATSGPSAARYSTPIINHPEVAILLLGRARWLPVAGGPQHDKVEIRLMLPLSLSYDHRLVDGAAAARFLNEVIGLLQAPAIAHGRVKKI